MSKVVSILSIVFYWLFLQYIFLVYVLLSA